MLLYDGARINDAQVSIDVNLVFHQIILKILSFLSEKRAIF